MRKKLRGSLTIEASFVIPIVLFIFAMLMTLFFYYHDKTVLAGAVQETAIYGTGRGNPSKQEIETFLTNQISGKMLLFLNINKEIDKKEDYVKVRCSSSARGMEVETSCQLTNTNPEQLIRELRKIEKLKEKAGDKSEDTDKEGT